MIAQSITIFTTNLIKKNYNISKTYIEIFMDQVLQSLISFTKMFNIKLKSNIVSKWSCEGLNLPPSSLWIFPPSSFGRVQF